MVLLRQLMLVSGAFIRLKLTHLLNYISCKEDWNRKRTVLLSRRRYTFDTTSMWGTQNIERHSHISCCQVTVQPLRGSDVQNIVVHVLIPSLDCAVFAR